MTVNLDIAVDDFDPALAAQLRPAVGAALKVSRVAPGERAGVNIRIVDRAESQRLNQQFRAKASPTNVLAFPVGDVVLPEGELSEELGNLAICLPVVRRESLEQAKSLESHLAHMVIHGTLHLLGYDHANDAEAEEMEELERVALKSLGFPDPYQPSVASVQSK